MVPGSPLLGGFGERTGDEMTSTRVRYGTRQGCAAWPPVSSRQAGALLTVLLLPLLGGRGQAQEVRVLESPEAVEELCSQLEARQPDGPPGDPVSRGWLRARLEEQRDTALAGSYRITLAAEEFHFDDYSPEHSRLTLHLSDGLAPFGGRVLLLPQGEKASLLLDMRDAQRLVEEHATRRVRLAVDFQLDAPEGNGSICDHEAEITGRRVRRVRVVPLHYRWIDLQGRVVASAIAEADDPAVQEQVTQLLQQARVRLDRARELYEEAAQDPTEPQPRPQSFELEGVLAPLLLPCLRERIAALHRPVEGSLVVELRCGEAGKDNQVSIRRRLMDDGPLMHCALQTLARIPLPVPGGCAARRFSIPIFFQSAKFE